MPHEPCLLRAGFVATASQRTPVAVVTGNRYEVLRKENIVMRQHLLQAQAERDELRNRVDMAAARLEALKAQLPADA